LTVTKKTIDKSKHKKYIAYPLLYAFFFTVVGLFVLYYPVIYSYDYAVSNITQDNIYIEDIIEPTANYGYRILGSNQEKYIVYIEYREEFSEYEDSLVGTRCEIEYYKLSKFVTKIKIIE